MFFWFNQDGHNTKLPKVRQKLNNKNLLNNQKNVVVSNNNDTIIYPKYSPLPAINSKHSYKKLERQYTYVVTSPIFVKPTKPSKQRKKLISLKDLKKGLKKKTINKNQENGMMWIDL